MMKYSLLIVFMLFVTSCMARPQQAGSSDIDHCLIINKGLNGTSDSLFKMGSKFNVYDVIFELESDENLLKTMTGMPFEKSTRVHKMVSRCKFDEDSSIRVVNDKIGYNYTLRISEIIITDDGKYAGFEVSYQSDMESGAGYFVLLELKKEWQFKNIYFLWIS